MKKILSKQIVEKLDNALTKGSMEDLRKQMEKLLGYKDIFNLHDQHLTELAECVVDLADADDRLECAAEMERYAKRCISLYRERKRKLIEKSQWAKSRNDHNEPLLLDLAYQIWTYDAGFEYSKFHMYSMLCRIIHTITAEERAGAK